MLTKLARTPKRFGSAHPKEIFDKAPKVAHKRVWINVEDCEGYYRRMPARIGDSLYSTLAKSSIVTEGGCDGGTMYNLRESPVEPNADEPYCEICYVEIEEPWFSKMMIHPFEQDKLNVQKLNVPMGYNTRMSCAIRVEQWMDELLVRVPYKIIDI